MVGNAERKWKKERPVSVMALITKACLDKRTGGLFVKSPPRTSQKLYQLRFTAQAFSVDIQGGLFGTRLLKVAPCGAATPTAPRKPAPSKILG
jgi:hypothetical protein